MENFNDELLNSSAPKLTFDPFPEEKKEAAVKKEETALKEEEPVFNESMLSLEERKMVDDFATQIDIGNATLIMQYGAGAQKKIADFSEVALGNVRTKDLGEVGDLLTSVVRELRSFDAEEESKGIRGFFKKNTDRLATMKAKYDKA